MKLLFYNFSILSSMSLSSCFFNFQTSSLLLFFGEFHFILIHVFFSCGLSRIVFRDARRGGLLLDSPPRSLFFDVPSAANLSYRNHQSQWLIWSVNTARNEGTYCNDLQNPIVSFIFTCWISHGMRFRWYATSLADNEKSYRWNWNIKWFMKNQREHKYERFRKPRYERRTKKKYEN